MLNRFFVIGLGGAGTTAVRFLQQSLRSLLLEKRAALREAGFDAEWPDAWRLLAVDVKSNQRPHDANVKRVTFADDVRDFYSLSVSSSDYDLLRTRLQRPRELRDAVDSWAPWRGGGKGVSLVDGAGQFRAIGRTVAVAGIRKLAEHLGRAFPTPDSNRQLRSVARGLGIPVGEREDIRTIMVVISSLAGGTGAGLFLDVCDLLCALAPGHHAAEDKLLALVFSPDIYTETLEFSKVPRVQANALATISELLSTSLSQGQDTAGTGMILGRAGGLALATERGPKIVMVIGSENLAGHNPTADVLGGPDERRVAYYEAAGHTLATWFVSPKIQGDLLDTYLANPNEQPESLTGLNPESRYVLSSVGFSSVGMGNNEFRDYAARRLARRAAENLIRGPEDLGWVDERVIVNRGTFIERSGLSELGPEKNQVLDFLRGGPAEASDQSRRIQEMVEETKKTHWRPRGFRVIAREWIEALERWVQEDGESARATEEKHYLGAAAEWAEQLPIDLAALVEEYAGAFGFGVARGLLKELKENVGDAAAMLAAEVAALQQERSTELPHIGAPFGRDLTRKSRTRYKLENKGPVVEAIDRAKALVWKSSEASLRALARELLLDAIPGVIEPLMAAVDAAAAQLRIEAQGEILHWPDHKVVPPQIAPMPTKQLLFDYQDVKVGFKARFDKAVADLYHQSVSDATDWAAGEVARGLADELAHSSAWQGTGRAAKGAMIELDRAEAWQPRPLSRQRGGGTSRARFTVRCSGSDLVENARRWIAQTGGALKRETEVNLVDALAGDSDLQLQFVEGLREALDLSLPLVRVQGPAMERTHGERAVTTSVVMSELPFQANSPLADQVRDFLRDRGVDVNSVAFGEGLRPSEVTVSTFLWPPLDLPAFSSIVEPIASKIASVEGSEAEWKRFFDRKRARRLDGFVPVSPAVLETLIRGFFVGEALGLLNHERARRPEWADTCTVFDPLEEAAQAFPRPLLQPKPGDEGLLPALLESLPLALVGFGLGAGVAGFEATKSYTVLMQLGARDGDGGRLSQYFASWLLGGAEGGSAHGEWLAVRVAAANAQNPGAGAQKKWTVPFAQIAQVSGQDLASRCEFVRSYFDSRLDFFQRRVFNVVRTGTGTEADEIRGGIEGALAGLVADVADFCA